jgi:hypothetical protein
MTPQLPAAVQLSQAPRVFFDGAGYALGFELGVLQWLRGEAEQHGWATKDWKVFGAREPL